MPKSRSRFKGVHYALGILIFFGGLVGCERSCAGPRVTIRGKATSDVCRRAKKSLSICYERNAARSGNTQSALKECSSQLAAVTSNCEGMR